jgi:hypothetical protein
MCSKDQSLDNALNKALETDPFTVAGELPGQYLVDSTTQPGKTYTVALNGGSLEGASCTCKAALRPYCVHRAAAAFYVMRGLMTAYAAEKAVA